jgi:hypothetical protein
MVRIDPIRPQLMSLTELAYLGLWALLASRRYGNRGGYGLARLVDFYNRAALTNSAVYTDWERGKIKFLADITT